MAKRKRRFVRPGMHLPVMEARAVIEGVGELRQLHEMLVAMGFAPPRTVRPYRRRDGTVTLRLVWRRRTGGRQASFHHTLAVDALDRIGGAE